MRSDAVIRLQVTDHRRFVKKAGLQASRQVACQPGYIAGPRADRPYARRGYSPSMLGKNLVGRAILMPDINHRVEKETQHNRVREYETGETHHEWWDTPANY